MSSLPPGSAVASSRGGGGGDAKALQDCLHDLLSRLADANIVLKNWGHETSAVVSTAALGHNSSSGDTTMTKADDDPQVHIEATTRLISNLHDVLTAIARVEQVVKLDEELYKTLHDCPIPLDLLDLMDCQGGLNPDCFSRGLLKEALGQLAGLKRRKLALDMLGDKIEEGMLSKLQEENDANGTIKGEASRTGNKRSRDEESTREEQPEQQPFTKRAKAS